MPKNTTILLIRHAEKPKKGDGLSIKGQQRAQAYSIYFQNYIPAGSKSPLQFSFLFAATDSAESHRPYLTIQPLAAALDIHINEKHPDDEYGKVARNILEKTKYDNSHILICWHHEEILLLAGALGVQPTSLPASANWPSSWPEDVFGWILQVVYDKHGDIVPSRTCCLSTKLMYDDYGQAPPAGK